jgi:hypothetical protein
MQDTQNQVVEGGPQDAAQIKFKYILLHPEATENIEAALTIEQLENGGMAQLTFDKPKSGDHFRSDVRWKVVSRRRFLGIFDAKGTEIYEGDIVSYDRSQRIGKYVFSEGCSRIENTNSLSYRDAIVIGDEFHNPELVDKLPPYHGEIMAEFGSFQPITQNT